MSERFSRIFSLTENLYAEGAPVIVKAGSLLRDNTTASLLAQLKLQNITSKVISLVKVQLTCFDSVNRPFDETVTHEYLDLNVARGEEFASRSPIKISNSAARAYAVRVVEVGFADNTIWHDGGSAWEPMPKTQPIQTVITDDTALLGYKTVFGSTATIALLEHKDVWVCTCGAVNRRGEDNCHRCEAARSALQALDLDALKAAGNSAFHEKQYATALSLFNTGDADSLTKALATLESIAEHEDAVALREKCLAAQAQLEVKQAKTKKMTIIVSAALLAAVILLVLTLTVFVPAIKYNKATTLMEQGEYSKAYDIFSGLGDFNHAISLKQECRYLEAVSTMNEGKYNDAKRQFEYFEDYKDSKEKILECQFAIALEKMEAKKYSEAYDELINLGKYPNAKEKAKECAELAGDAALADNQYRKAVEWYEKAENSTKANEAKYQYALLAKEKNDNNDYTAYSYLKDLVEAQYKDAASVYSQLYDWRVTVTAINNSSASDTPATSISRFSSIYVHFKLTGGTPYQGTKLYLKYTEPDGKKGTYEWNSSVNEGSFWFKYTESKYKNTQNTTGKFEIEFYENAKSTKVIGSGSIVVN